MAGKLFIFGAAAPLAALVAACVLLAAPWLPRGGLPYLAAVPWLLISICSPGCGETSPTGTVPAGPGWPQQHCRGRSSERGQAGFRRRHSGCPAFLVFLLDALLGRVHWAAAVIRSLRGWFSNLSIRKPPGHAGDGIARAQK